MILKDLEPKKVFTYFEEITKIPHGSGNEKELSDYILKFAKDRGLEAIQDECNNLIIKKPAYKGYEDKPAVIIQGHLDMVCEKNNDTEHDFKKDPLRLIIDGDYIKTDGTTLGGDDGIAVAYAMALIDSDDIEHPPLEIVLTIEEETGMKGAREVSPDLLSAKYMINIDSEEEDWLLVSCAGGAKVKVNVPVSNSDIDDEYNCYAIKIRGLKGGHSGIEIDRNRANSNKLLCRVLYDLNQKYSLNIVSIDGGAKDNAIPREADAVIAVKIDNDKELSDDIVKWNNTFKSEYSNSDKGVKVILEQVEKSTSSFDNKTTNAVIELLMLVPNGIQTMSNKIEGLVESSLNLGVIKMKANSVELTLSLRSSVATLLDNMLNKLKIISKLYDSEFVITGQYPAWEFKQDSKLQQICSRVYKEVFNRKPDIKAIHAGLECGLFCEKIDDIDIVSIGPNILDIHTPDERLSISSSARMWEYLLEILKNID